MKIEKDDNLRITITDFLEDGTSIDEQSVQAVLLYEILQMSKKMFQQLKYIERNTVNKEDKS